MFQIGNRPGHWGLTPSHYEKSHEIDLESSSVSCPSLQFYFLCVSICLVFVPHSLDWKTQEGRECDPVIHMAQHLAFSIKSTPLPVAYKELCILASAFCVIPLSGPQIPSHIPSPIPLDIFSSWNSLPPHFAWLFSMQNVIQMSLPQQGCL